MPDPLPLVVSIQSQVAFGHVGNSAAAAPMRACGVEVVEVPTALLSNHPHYPTMRGRVLEPALVADLLVGLVERGVHARAAVILSGFLGEAGAAAAVADFVRAAREANPGVIYACDPVMGDADIGFFAKAPLREAFASLLVPRADLILPNAFELAALAGFPIESAADVERARAALGGPAVVATSVPVAAAPERLGIVTAAPGDVTVVEVARLSVRPAGTGDLLSGLVAARLALGLPLAAAVAHAVAGVRVALEGTAAERWAEMPIAARLRAIVDADPG
ncbi:pyridoxal kinase [Amaricoccus sp.]|uniref:pyridoxal kinase n=1 Tax=Amaricoccus sp. TaxID=1872485 RepID=UPI001B57CC19|nr:pyridoxal kinase [Amaricoccus sp.]MBP7243578.1 pyridoxal kinase [Amaricoccus sp.]